MNELVDVLEKLPDSGPMGLLVLLLIVVVGSFVWMMHRVLNHIQVSAQTCHESHSAIARESAGVIGENNRVLGEVGGHLKDCAESQRDLQRAMRERAAATPPIQVSPQPQETQG